ncbi:MAG: DUF2118 domain-containing protein [Thermoprotei archaeon]|nr:DUF2118 domain-containing protein [Thermoprotei archaeon]
MRGQPLDYKPSDYLFPELYVKGYGGGECVEVDLESMVYQASPQGGYCKVIYESGWSLILDLEGAKASRSFIVTIPWNGYKAVMVEEGAKLNLIEVRGVEVYIVSREGGMVGERSVLAYAVSRKGETRTRRAGVKGIVAYIAWEPGSVPPRYVFAIAENYKILSPKTRV